MYAPPFFGTLVVGAGVLVFIFPFPGSCVVTVFSAKHVNMKSQGDNRCYFKNLLFLAHWLQLQVRFCWTLIYLFLVSLQYLCLLTLLIMQIRNKKNTINCSTFFLWRNSCCIHDKFSFAWFHCCTLFCACCDNFNFKNQIKYFYFYF